MGIFATFQEERLLSLAKTHLDSSSTTPCSKTETIRIIIYDYTNAKRQERDATDDRVLYELNQIFQEFDIRKLSIEGIGNDIGKLDYVSDLIKVSNDIMSLTISDSAFECGPNEWRVFYFNLSKLKNVRHVSMTNCRCASPFLGTLSLLGLQSLQVDCDCLLSNMDAFHAYFYTQKGLKEVNITTSKPTVLRDDEMVDLFHILEHTENISVFSLIIK
jgi:hypothetical protein